MEGFEAIMSSAQTPEIAPPRTVTTAPNATPKQIWAVGGGKGGVGKSLIAANISIALARAGKKVCAIDLDLGAANLHTCLGIEIPQVTLSDFFSRREPDIKNVLVPTPV